MTRRQLLARLALWPLAAQGLAGASGEGEKRREEGKEAPKKEEKGEKRGERPVYYGRVEAVEAGTLWAGGRALPSSSPLLPYLAPGMVVEVAPEGLQVLVPEGWAYYEGPGSLFGLSLAWARLWWVEGKVWKVLPGAGQEAILVARYHEGKWRGVPPGLSLPRPPKEGWWLVRLEGLKGRLERFLQ
ncbi:hypothetical protein TJA_19850 [Thermus sp. LT1-2-5]|uniref:hypothetical protein n=1 Tax=Thermus sp. LT1-2-5 TaxID=3026935 RepID=UPI0030E7FEDD